GEATPQGHSVPDGAAILEAAGLHRQKSTANRPVPVQSANYAGNLCQRYLQCADANRDAVALLRGKVRLLRGCGKGGRNGGGRRRGDRSAERQDDGTSQLRHE
ncbi:unnamed protein product, partial [Heterotrigona itama]